METHSMLIVSICLQHDTITFDIGSLINQRLVIYYRSALMCLLYDVCNTLKILNKTSTVDVQEHHVCKTSIILISADWS